VGKTSGFAPGQDHGRIRKTDPGPQKSGRLLAGAKLDRSASSVTVREKNGKPVTSDGPFAETKEQLGGYHVIDCKDRDEAVSSLCASRRSPQAA
jgi:hypothetical protein